MPTALVFSLIEQGAELAKEWPIELHLQFFNEPLLDVRLSEFAEYGRELGSFQGIGTDTNGDALTPELASELDGSLNKIQVALYDGEGENREQTIRQMFRQTEVFFAPRKHIISHHSPYRNLSAAIAQCRAQPCWWEAQIRMILSYTGDMCLCCEDIIGEWDLGSAKRSSLEELWFGSKHRYIIDTLCVPGGRVKYEYCSICPRPNRPYPTWRSCEVQT